jgi:hypothetical protein
MAWPFDAHRLQVTGELSPVAEQAGHSLKYQESFFSVSEIGVLAYQDVASEHRQLIWFDRGGTPLGVVGQAGTQSTATLSADAKRVARTSATHRWATATSGWSGWRVALACVGKSSFIWICAAKNCWSKLLQRHRSLSCSTGSQV